MNAGDENRKFGLAAGHALIRVLGWEQCRPGANEFKCKRIGKRGVVKTASPGNNTVGVTNPMMTRLDFVVVAFQRKKGKGDEDKKRVFDLYALDIVDYRKISYPPASGRPEMHARRKQIEEKRANEQFGVPLCASIPSGE